MEPIYKLSFKNHGYSSCQFDSDDDPSIFCSSFQENWELWTTSWSNPRITCSKSSRKSKLKKLTQACMYFLVKVIKNPRMHATLILLTLVCYGGGVKKRKLVPHKNMLKESRGRLISLYFLCQKTPPLISFYLLFNHERGKKKKGSKGR